MGLGIKDFKYEKKYLTEQINKHIPLTTFNSGYLQAMKNYEKLILLNSSLLLKEDYKTGFDEWKVENGYKKDIKHKCYFKGDKAYFDFNLIEEYDKEVKSNL